MLKRVLSNEAQAELATKTAISVNRSFMTDDDLEWRYHVYQQYNTYLSALYSKQGEHQSEIPCLQNLRLCNLQRVFMRRELDLVKNQNPMCNNERANALSMAADAVTPRALTFLTQHNRKLWADAKKNNGVLTPKRQICQHIYKIDLAAHC